MTPASGITQTRQSSECKKGSLPVGVPLLGVKNTFPRSLSTDSSSFPVGHTGATCLLLSQLLKGEWDDLSSLPRRVVNPLVLVTGTAFSEGGGWHRYRARGRLSLQGTGKNSGRWADRQAGVAPALSPPPPGSPISALSQLTWEADKSTL